MCLMAYHIHHSSISPYMTFNYVLLISVVVVCFFLKLQIKIEGVKHVFVLSVHPFSPISQLATVTQMWWRQELSRWNCSTPTHVSCMTTSYCTPRGCRPHCPTSCLCATLSTLGTSAFSHTPPTANSINGRLARLVFLGVDHSVGVAQWDLIYEWN